MKQLRHQQQQLKLHRLLKPQQRILALQQLAAVMSQLQKSVFLASLSIQQRQLKLHRQQMQHQLRKLHRLVQSHLQLNNHLDYLQHKKARLGVLFY
jgi:hypothetical protein